MNAVALRMAFLGVAVAQIPPPGMSPVHTPVQSSSGQFVLLNAPEDAASSPLARLSSNTNFIYLDPMLLVVSCERIKQKLWDKLQAAGPWRGKVYLSLHTAHSADELVAIAADKSPNGWDYRMALPNVLPRERFLRAIVQVLLSEMANRNAGSHAAEIPLWLLEGLCGELRGPDDLELFLPPPTLNVHGLNIRPQSVETKWSNPGEEARTQFRSRPPLSFEQLSWPVEDQLAGEGREIYGLSAVLFVDSLLHLPDGTAGLRSLLEELPRHYNWQIAFLQSFRSQFQTPLDVEKWWALQVVYFTGRGLFDRWTPDESLARLNQALRARIEVRTTGKDLPLASEIDLQTVIREWDLARQAPTLRRKLFELDLLRMRITPEWVSLVEAYRSVIQTYLQQRGLLGPLSGKRLGPAVSDRVSEAALGQLATLDSNREALKPVDQMNRR